MCKWDYRCWTNFEYFRFDSAKLDYRINIVFGRVLMNKQFGSLLHVNEFLVSVWIIVISFIVSRISFQQTFWTFDYFSWMLSNWLLKASKGVTIRSRFKILLTALGFSYLCPFTNFLPLDVFYCFLPELKVVTIFFFVSIYLSLISGLSGHLIIFVLGYLLLTLFCYFFSTVVWTLSRVDKSTITYVRAGLCNQSTSIASLMSFLKVALGLWKSLKLSCDIGVFSESISLLS